MSYLLEIIRSFSSILSFSPEEESPKPDSSPADDWGFLQLASTASTSSMTRWLACELTGDLVQVPLVGDQTQTVLKRANITSSYQLLGAFYMLCARDAKPSDIVDNYAVWLKSIGVHASLVERIAHAVAAKVHSMNP